MREHRFRYWNKTKKEMVLVVGIFNQHPYMEKSTFPQYESCPKMDDVVVMEWTGMKDCHGTDIYEGDIVRMYFGGGGPEHDKKHQYGTIEFSQGNVGPCTGNNVMEWKTDNWHNLMNGPDVEIMGNIWEDKR